MDLFQYGILQFTQENKKIQAALLFDKWNQETKTPLEQKFWYRNWNCHSILANHNEDIFKWANQKAKRTIAIYNKAVVWAGKQARESSHLIG